MSHDKTMIFGVGTDIVETLRFRDKVSDERFMNRVYTEAEAEYITARGKTSHLSAAGIFAAKEAFSKAVGCGFRGFNLCDVEIRHDTLSKPYLMLYGIAQEKFEELTFELSISHCENYATAVVVAMKE